MCRIPTEAAVGLLLICAAGVAAAQPTTPAAAEGADSPPAANRSRIPADESPIAGDAADETAAEGDRRREIGPSLDSCFNSQGMIDISVLDDQHLYVRTRGSNYYLITTDHCDNLERSFLHRTAWLIPHGRTVCRDDGSHVLYNDAGRRNVCPIRVIERVDSRQQARDLAAGKRTVEGLEELPVE